MKNVCTKCKYLEVERYPESDYYSYCKCGIEEDYLDGNGCNYSKEMLSLLYKYTVFENSEFESSRTSNDRTYVAMIEKELKRKQENGEDIDFCDQIELSIAREHLDEVKKMDKEYKRCNYLRFFEKNDPDGKLRRHLKRKGQYPYWIHDLFYVENYDKYKEQT